MITAKTAGFALALARHTPFDRLTATELLSVSQYVRRRDYAPGAVLLGRGSVAERLTIVVDGSVYLDGVLAPAVFDAPSTLFGLSVRTDYRAGAMGAETLTLARAHLFTIARECPDFIVGLTPTLAKTSQTA